MIIKNFDVEIWMNDYENDCLYNLSETCASPLTVEELLDITGCRDKAVEEILNIKLDYGAITGSQRLRNAISTMYTTVSPENITMAHGAIGANSLALMSITGPGDHVVSVVPTYQQHYSLPQALGAEITLVPLKEENNWMPDLRELDAAVTPDTRVICINNPNNPTGAVMNDSILKEIVKIAEKNDCYLFCDEAYRGLNHNKNPLGTSVADMYNKSIVTGSMSKAFSLAGLRLGWICAPADVIADINRHRDYHIISIGKIDEYLSALAIENKDTIFSRNAALCRRNIDLIENWVNSEPLLSFVKPEASTTSFIKFNLNMGSEEFCRRIQQETGVMFVPGSAFTYDDHFRLGFGNDSSIIENGLHAVSDWLKQF